VRPAEVLSKDAGVHERGGEYSHVRPAVVLIEHDLQSARREDTVPDKKKLLSSALELMRKALEEEEATARALEEKEAAAWQSGPEPVPVHGVRAAEWREDRRVGGRDRGVPEGHNSALQRFQAPCQMS
jgi:hypothetical protein